MKDISKPTIVIAILFLSLLFPFIAVSQYRSIISYITLLVVLYALIRFCSFQQRSLFRNEWAKPSNLFLLALVVLYFQQTLDLELGYKSVSYFISGDILNSCNVISAIGILSYVLGYYITTNKPSESPYFESSRIKIWPIVLMQYVFFILFVTSIDLYSFLNGSDFSSGYAKSLSVSAYLEWMLQACNIACLSIVVKNYSGDNTLKSFIRQIPVSSLIVIVLYILLRIPSGDRGPVIASLLALFYSFIFATKKKIRVIVLLASLAIGAFSVSVMGLARNYDLKLSLLDRIEIASNQMKSGGRFEDTQSFFAPTQELSFSFLSYQCQVKGILIDHDDYHYGMYSVYRILNAIPFVPGILAREFNIDEDEMSSADYATHKYLGDDPHWGLGTNCIGEFFLDFGVFGVILGMLFAGFCFRRIDNAIYLGSRKSTSLAMFAFSLVYSSTFLSIARGGFLQGIKQFVMVVIILLLGKFVTNQRYRLLN